MIELAIVVEIWDNVLRISRICPVQNVPSIGSQTLFFFPYLEIVACNT